MPENQPGIAPPRNAVLITRHAEAARRTADRLRALGLVPVQSPLYTIRPRPLAPPPGIDAILVTSGNAIPALAALARPGLPVLAVGDATAHQARAAGLHQVESAAGNADALLALARQRLQPGARLLLATGAGQGVPLAAALRQAGFRVHRRTAYATIPAPCLPPAAAAALEAGTLRAALFLSAETAALFARLLPPHLRPALAGIDALAIAPAVADRLTPLPWRHVRVSVGPTLDQVLALL